MDWGSFFVGWMVGVGLVWLYMRNIIKRARERIPPEYWPEDLFG